MLRITTLKTQSAATLRVEGKLVGPWVGELELSWRSVSSEPANGRLCVDLTDVTFVDEEGKRLLEVMYAEGVKLKASGCVTRRLVEEIERSLHRAPLKNGV